jgi:hypothetical protein
MMVVVVVMVAATTTSPIPTGTSRIEFPTMTGAPKIELGRC